MLEQAGTGRHRAKQRTDSPKAWGMCWRSLQPGRAAPPCSPSPASTEHAVHGGMRAQSPAASPGPACTLPRPHSAAHAWATASALLHTSVPMHAPAFTPPHTLIPCAPHGRCRLPAHAPTRSGLHSCSPSKRSPSSTGRQCPSPHSCRSAPALLDPDDPRAWMCSPCSALGQHASCEARLPGGLPGAPGASHRQTLTCVHGEAG